jgi:hypothetical protein
VGLKLPKPAPLKAVLLACLIRKSYDFAVCRVVQGFFQGGIRLKIRFGIADSQVDALFRLMKLFRAFAVVPTT